MLKLFQKVRPNTAIHPEYKKLVEKIADIDGKAFYMFKNLLDMPHNRYDKCVRFSTEFNMRLDADTLKQFIETSKEAINKGDFTKVSGLLQILEQQTEMLISMDASYRLASCVYFWIDEDLKDYDYEIGDEKIALFKKYSFNDFFLSEPMSKFLPQINLSEQDLQAYLLIEKETKKLLSRNLNAKKGIESKTTT